MLTVIIGMFSFTNDKNFNDTTYLLKHSNALLGESDDTYALAKEIESSGNSYLFTHDVTALNEYENSVQKVRESIDTLKYLTRHEPELQPAIDTLTALIDSHIKFVNGYINLVIGKEFDKTEQTDYVHRNREYTDKINTIINEIQAREDNLLQQRELANERSITNFHWIFYSLISCMFTLLVCVIGLLIHNSNQRAKADAKLKENQDRLFKISNFSPVPTYITEAGTEKIVYANASCEKLFFKRKEEIVGKHISELSSVFIEPHAVMLKRLKQAKDGGAHNGIDVQVKIEGNEVKDMLFSADTVEIDDKDCYLETMVDISEIIKEENAMRSALAKEKELGEMKSRFVSFASHEFRTPLATILSSAQLVKQYQADKLDNNSQKHIKRIESNVNNLIDLLNDFLSLGKLEEGKIYTTPEKLDLLDFITEITDNMKTLLKDGQKITTEISGADGEVFMDEKLLRNVLNNLLSNAIKYSPPGSEINFRIVFYSEHIYFIIQDHGIGIPEEDQKHLFESFFRSNNATQVPGTGLGLTIVKRYLDLMNGTIEFKSNVNEGTTFTVHLPKVANAPKAI